MLLQVAPVVIIEGINRRENVQGFCLNARFLQQFANSGMFDSLAAVDFTAWKAPKATIRRVGAPHQQYLALVKNNSNGGDNRPAPWRD